MFDCYVRFLECTISSLSTTMQGKNHKFGLFAKNITGLHRLLNGKVLHFFWGGIRKKQHPKHQDLSSYPWGVSPSHPCVAHGSNPGRKMQIECYIIASHSNGWNPFKSFMSIYVSCQTKVSTTSKSSF